MVAAHPAADHDHMVRNASLIALAGLACALAAGCGDDATPDAADAKPRPAQVNLERFLLQPGEEPGFKPAESPRVDSSVEAFGLPPAGVKRLRESGYVSTTFQPITGDDRTGGVTNVNLFTTETGAQAWLEYVTSTEAIRDQIPGAKIRRFTVRGIPNARGLTGRDQHGHPMGHVFWVQGRCMLLLGNEGEGDLVEPLSTGAKAIHDRTNGVCP